MWAHGESSAIEFYVIVLVALLFLLGWLELKKSIWSCEESIGH